MSINVGQALEIPPLDQCDVVAGLDGLDREINSINIVDSPDPGPWVSQGQFILTTGYVFRDDPDEQVKLIRLLVQQGCAGLAIKFARFISEPPLFMIKEANRLRLPLINIPYQISQSEIISSLMNGVLQHKHDQKIIFDIKTFFKAVIDGNIHGHDEILDKGYVVGLIPNCEYIVLCTSLSLQKNSNLQKIKIFLRNIIRDSSISVGLDPIVSELDEVVALLQVTQRKTEEDSANLIYSLVKHINELFSKQFPDVKLFIGISTPKMCVTKIRKGFLESQEAIYLGRRIADADAHTIYEYEKLKPYVLLQSLHTEDCQQYIESSIKVLIDHDEQNKSDLTKTLDLYLANNGRSSDCSQKLFIHQNTIRYRISRIEELLGVDLNDGETIFRLQLAFKLAKLVDTLPL